MRIGFVVNDVATEQSGYSTTRLAMQAHAMGHEVYLMGIGDFTYEADGGLAAHGRTGSAKTYRSLERFLKDAQKPDRDEIINIHEFDVVMLRSDPAVDASDQPWANNAGVAFGRLMAKAGVLVVNDPTSLAHALSKAYFQHFPEAVRPKTLISRDEQRLQEFVKELGGRAVLKPLQGSGGSGVFLVNDDESPNLNQIIEAVARDGYVVAQEYLPEASEGDVRMWLMNGRPLKHRGKYAAFRRRNETADMRSNVSAGGKVVQEVVTDKMLEIADIVRPKLVADGMFLVGLDIVGDKLMEVNVFSPGGLGISQTLYDVNFAELVIGDLERKVEVRRHYGAKISNTDLATL